MDDLWTAGDHRAQRIVEIFVADTFPFFPLVVVQRNLAAADLREFMIIEVKMSELDVISPSSALPKCIFDQV